MTNKLNKKTCIKCGVTLVLDTNWLESRQKRYDYRCKRCCNNYKNKHNKPEYQQRWIAKNREHVRKYQREYRKQEYKKEMEVVNELTPEQKQEIKNGIDINSIWDKLRKQK